MRVDTDCMRYLFIFIIYVSVWVYSINIGIAIVKPIGVWMC